MTKRLICLILSILMIIPVCMLAGCGAKTDEDIGIEITDEASKATVTLAMYLMTDQHVCTPEELAQIKDEKGVDSPEYIEAKGIYDAHEKVEFEMNKITKAKYKTQLNVYWLTEDEYYTVIEEKMKGYAEEVAFKTKAQTTFETFRKEQKKLDKNLTETEIWYKFTLEYPEYANLIEKPVDPNETTEETVEETIKGESGFIELKYPDEKKNQVDIIYIGGYDMYSKYVNNGWLQALDSQIKDGDAKALKAYINAAFFDAMAIGGKSYAIPTNTAIGEYTYLLVDRELYTNYYYPIDEIDSISSIVDIYDFLEDIDESGLGIVPITGELGLTNTHFWSTAYEYVIAENIMTLTDVKDAKSAFEKGLNEGKSYYVKNEDGTYALVGKCFTNMEYFSYDKSSKTYTLQGKVSSLPTNQTNYILSADCYVKADSFVSGVTYYVADAYGNYTVAADITAFAEGVQYYKLDSAVFKKIDKESYVADSGVVFYTKSNGEFKKAINLKAFEDSTDYYVVSDSLDEEKGLKDMYVPYGAYEEGVEYYIAKVTFTPDEFSILGSGYGKDEDPSGKLDFENVFAGNLDYTEQLLALKKIEENGYYNKDAINSENMNFATAIIKGGPQDIAKYADKYEVVVLEYPRADFTKMYDNLFAVPAASVKIDRAMSVLTLLNTDEEFRNLVQYGVLNDHYTVSTVEIDDVEYAKIERLNNYYMMDINKTGNLFVAYPEEGMPVDIWKNAKIQNRDSLKLMLAGFDLNSLTSPDLELIDAVAAISAEWKALIDACETAEELEALLERAATETEALEVLKNAMSTTSTNTHSLSVIYTKWFNTKYPSK